MTTAAPMPDRLIEQRDDLRRRYDQHLKTSGRLGHRLTSTQLHTLLCVLVGDTAFHVAFERLVWAYRDNEVTL